MVGEKCSNYCSVFICVWCVCVCSVVFSGCSVCVVHPCLRAYICVWFVHVCGLFMCT